MWQDILNLSSFMISNESFVCLNMVYICKFISDSFNFILRFTIFFIFSLKLF